MNIPLILLIPLLVLVAWVWLHFQKSASLGLHVAGGGGAGLLFTSWGLIDQWASPEACYAYLIVFSSLAAGGVIADAISKRR